MYESMHESPLNINTATREELSQLPFLTFKQIEDIHAYIYMHGPMLSLGELQLTGSLDYETRKMLRHELADSQGFMADGGAILSIVYS